MLTAIAAAILASALTAIGARLLSVHRQVASHDRRIAALNQDLRRWVRDRHQRRKAELARTSNENAARGQVYSGSHHGSLKLVAEQVREEWRNELSLKLRAFDAILDEEGRLHELIRRRATDRPALEAPSDVLAKLEEWRAPLQPPGGPPIEIEDPMSSDLEPELAKFEEWGRREFPRRRLRTGTLAQFDERHDRL